VHGDRRTDHRRDTARLGQPPAHPRVVCQPDAGEHELAEIADRLRRAVAPALDLPYPDPEAVRLAALAEQIAPRTAGE
jgi:hypothetical protein